MFLTNIKLFLEVSLRLRSVPPPDTSTGQDGVRMSERMREAEGGESAGPGISVQPR